VCSVVLAYELVRRRVIISKGIGQACIEALLFYAPARLRQCCASSFTADARSGRVESANGSRPLLTRTQLGSDNEEMI
jgi:hypothetical protein